MKKFILTLGVTLAFTYSYAQVERQVTAFKELSVTDRLAVTLIPAAYNAVHIKGEREQEVQVIQQGDKLRLALKNGFPTAEHDLAIQVYYTDMAHLSLKKGAIVQNVGHTLTLPSLKVEAAEGAKVDLKVAVPTLAVSATTGAQVLMRGTVERQDISILFGGSYDGEAVDGHYVTAKINGGGKGVVRASVGVDLYVRGGGVLQVHGKPAESKVKTVLGGKIDFLDK